MKPIKSTISILEHSPKGLLNNVRKLYRKK